ncbi:MAG: type I 3-dehydroquinate dehydratase [Chthoniobacterales bacterium]|jgi:3-dehydroquinate dehydratase-1
MKQKQKPIGSSCAVVATAHTVRGLRLAAELAPHDDVDYVEIRLDQLAAQESTVAAALPAIRRPILLTARHPAEGGAKGVPMAHRRFLLQRFLPLAAMVDVEIRSAKAFNNVLLEARHRGIKQILSFHNFRTTPDPRVLLRMIKDGKKLGADIVKLATQLLGPADLATLLFVQATSEQGVATMGMGQLGKVSRLVLPAAGSALVYGYLDRPQVDGQWPVEDVARRLQEVM